MLAALAVFAAAAGNVVGGGHPVTRLELGHPFANLDDVAGDLVPQHQRRFLDAVPLHHVGAADAAGDDLDQHLARPDLGDRLLLQAYVVVVVIHGYAHGGLLNGFRGPCGPR